ncbi:hypothetical protein HN51_004857 [Arachis hypogaea]
MMRSAESLQAETNRFTGVVESKLRDVEAREDNLRRQSLLSSQIVMKTTRRSYLRGNPFLKGRRFYSKNRKGYFNHKRCSMRERITFLVNLRN